MKVSPMKLLQAGLIVAMFGLAGCAYRVEGPGFAVTNEPVPAAYPEVAYDPVYYDVGWYSGPYWYWYGPNHRLFHELRADHERRFYAYHHHEWR